MSRRSLPPLALLYHGVADVPLHADPHRLFVRPEDLEHQVATLRGWGYELLSFGELAARAGRGDAENCAALTFDDGLVDNLTSLLPLVRRLAAPATVFVISGWLGKTYPWNGSTRLLTGGEVAQLAAGGVEIGSHTVTHPDLTSIGYEGALEEFVRSRDDLERIAGEPLRAVAYPYGRATPETIRAARAAGFTAACRISGEGDWGDPLNLPRQNMHNRGSKLSLRLKREDLYEKLMRYRAGRAVRMVARRMR